MSWSQDEEWEDMGGIHMRQNLSTDSASSHRSGISSGLAQSIDSPNTNNSSYDGGSPFPEESTYPPYQYPTFIPSPYPTHAATNNHLTLSNPNGIIPSNQWLQPPPPYSPGQFCPGPFAGPDLAAYPPPEENVRYTPESLRWPPGTPLLKSYTLIDNKGKDPYLELLPDADVTPETPPRVYLGNHSSTQQKTFACEYPAKTKCVDKRGRPLRFNRSADLGRHYIIHKPKEQQDTYRCSYPKCNRDLDDPFTRKDHYRDHLREYHGEDLGRVKRKRSDTDASWFEKQQIWLRGRNINSKIWRCEKCLTNNKTAQGWSCVGAKCKTPCEEPRREARLRLAEAEERSRAFVCNLCRGSGFWIENNYGFELCPHCQGAEAATMAGGYESFDRGTYGTDRSYM